MKFSATAIVASALLLQDAAGRGMLILFSIESCPMLTFIKSSNVLLLLLSRTLASVVCHTTILLTPCLSPCLVRTRKSLGHTTGTKLLVVDSTLRLNMFLCCGATLPTFSEIGQPMHRLPSTLVASIFWASMSLTFASLALEPLAWKWTMLSRLGSNTWSLLLARHFSAPLL